jgi:predicted acetyltransferase
MRDDVTAGRPEPIRPEEMAAWDAAARRAFHEPVRAEDVAYDALVFEAERALAVRDGDEIVATAGALTRRLAVPGGTWVPAAAVTAVGVTAGHTRRGHLGRLMRRQLDDVHAAGEPVAALYASEGAIYGRYGYGLASRSMHYELRLPTAALRPDAPVPSERAHVVPPADALGAMVAVYATAFPAQPGLFERTTAWFERRIYDPEHRRNGDDALRAVIQPDADGRPAGYALYGAHSGWDALGPAGAVRVRELIAATPEARAGLWRFLLGLDLMRTLVWERAPEHDPLEHLLASTDPLTRESNMGLWVRLVNAPAALTARAYSAPFSLVIEIDDPFCAWNAGRHRLTYDGNAATCEPTADAPDLACPVDALGAAYLGGTPLEGLAGAGRVRELRPGAVHAAAAAFRGVPEPWCADPF